MPSAVLAWLDCSEADQRRAREIVAMFSQPESRDELGLGRFGMLWATRCSLEPRCCSLGLGICCSCRGFAAKAPAADAKDRNFLPGWMRRNGG